MSVLERFIGEYSEKAFQFAFHLCGNSEEAAELVQEAFFRVIRKWDQFDQGQPLENWFLTILRNVYYDDLRRYDRRIISLDMPLSSEGAEGFTLGDNLPDAREEALLDRLERLEKVDGVQAAMAELTAEHRAILTLFDLQGKSYEQICVVLDCPLGTVRSRLARARGALRKALLERHEEVLES